MVLIQENSKGQALPVHYGSCLLSRAECNYSATERECLAVREAVKIFRPYLYGSKFNIITDHKALIWLDKHKDERNKLMKWSLELQEYDYDIKYRPGDKAPHVDALSRLPIQVDNDLEINMVTIQKSQLISDQLCEPLYRDLIQYLTKRSLPKEDKNIKEIINLSQHFEVDNGILYHI